MPELRSRDQERAAFAWKEIEKARTQLRDGMKEYVNVAKGLPALIVGNGLMQTLAFQNAKENGNARVVDAVLSWLQKELDLHGGAQETPFVQVMRALHQGDSERYMLATEEALEFLRWMRQFAAAVAKG